MKTSFAIANGYFGVLDSVTVIQRVDIKSAMLGLNFTGTVSVFILIKLFLKKGCSSFITRVPLSKNITEQRKGEYSIDWLNISRLIVNL